MNQTTSPAAGDALRDLWIELSLAPHGSAPAPSSGAAPSSGGSGGSGAQGYGLSLVVQDHFSAERIMRIMRDLCERDARRKPPAQPDRPLDP